MELLKGDLIQNFGKAKRNHHHNSNSPKHFSSQQEHLHNRIREIGLSK